MTIDREIKYNRETKDFDCYVDGRYIGSRANYRDGDMLCDQVAYDLIEEGSTLTAAELDPPIDIPDEYPDPTPGGPEPPEFFVTSRAPFCALPDNLCSVHDPCPAHAADAARFLAQRSLDTWQPAAILVDDLPF